jgi:hypothetical protein
MTWPRFVVGILLMAHGLVHLLYVAPDVPFTLERSWLVPSGARRPFAFALMGAIILAFTLVVLALWGVPGLSEAWPVLTLIAAGLSAFLLVAYWNTQLLLGVLFDVALIVAAVTRPEWVEDLVA